ncbi:hypothetical protein [Arcobacter sp. LA11]|uniref:hypothetical protein n=1 Tax=Arcobacter sp. LA11 TaxID=1898176 RepID=UPI000933EF84|nr:hypothetical protein [Arcobacter sp. LA11]
MINNICTEKLYLSTKKQFEDLIYTKEQTEGDLLNIIKKLDFSKNFAIFQENNYNFDEVSNLFRFYEDELKSSFFEDKNLFKIEFKCYILLIKTFTELCITFATNKERRKHIDSFFQILKESKNLLKFFIPLEEKDIKTINNLIGEQLYYFSHIQYIHTKDKELDYIFEEYYLNLERQIHGYELSLSTNFGNKELNNKDIEYMIFINNSSFLLLKMIHKLNYYKPQIKFFENDKFKKVLSLFHKISLSHKESDSNTIEQFEKTLTSEFLESTKYLKKHKNHNMKKEKVQLLQLNTDEYKQLIDIILSLKE